jgi:hypothetical protein
MSEAVRLSRSYEELQNIFSQMKTVARNNALLGARVATTEQRVADFGKELEKLSTAPSPQTNDLPAFVPDPPDAPKP